MNAFLLSTFAAIVVCANAYGSSSGGYGAGSSGSLVGGRAYVGVPTITVHTIGTGIGGGYGGGAAGGYGGGAAGGYGGGASGGYGGGASGGYGSGAGHDAGLLSAAGGAYSPAAGARLALLLPSAGAPLVDAIGHGGSRLGGYGAAPIGKLAYAVGGSGYGGSLGRAGHGSAAIATGIIGGGRGGYGGSAGGYGGSAGGYGGSAAY